MKISEFLNDNRLMLIPAAREDGIEDGLVVIDEAQREKFEKEVNPDYIDYQAEFLKVYTQLETFKKKTRSANKDIAYVQDLLDQTGEYAQQLEEALNNPTVADIYTAVKKYLYNIFHK